MKTANIDGFYNNLKHQAQNTSNRISASPPLRAARSLETKIAKHVDKLPKAVSIGLHAVPFVNAGVHYFKEKGLEQRVPELYAFEQADRRFKALDAEVDGLTKQRNHLMGTIASMHRTRADLVVSKGAHPKGIKGLKSRCAWKLANTQVSKSRIKDQQKELDKTNKLLGELSPKHRQAETRRSDCHRLLQTADADGRVAAVKKDRKLHRNIFRVSLLACTAAAVALVALSAFSVIPAFIGIGACFAVGLGVGTHIALSQKEKWKVDAESTLRNATLSD